MKSVRSRSWCWNARHRSIESSCRLVNKRRQKYALGCETLEQRTVLSAAFTVLPPIQAGPTPVLPAVGTFDSGGVTRPFIAVTTDGGEGNTGVTILLGNGGGGFSSQPMIKFNTVAYPELANPEGIVVGHFTNSGFDDLAVACN